MPDTRGAFSWNEILPRLVTAHESGRLVPFIGVGMSAPHCASWAELIEKIEKAAGISIAPPTKDTKPEELIRRANLAARKLRASTASRFREAFRGALFKQDIPTSQTEALASIWWPLVLSTNYDDFYPQAFRKMHGQDLLAVTGRSSEDCQRVLSSLTVAGRAVLWALQGHVTARPLEEYEDRVVRDHLARLASELVLDHAEYRRVTYTQPHFRRAFAEVFRTRSLLFLGSGLREYYLQELFGEVLELYGPGSRTHYAIMPTGEVDPRFIYERFQIAVFEYEPSDGPAPHDEVPRRLRELKQALDNPEAAGVAWHWGSVEQTRRDVTHAAANLEIVRGPLPTEPITGDCLVLSAGGRISHSNFYISDALQRTLDGWRGETSGPPRVINELVGRYEGCAVFAARARGKDTDVKDLLKVREASHAVFEAAKEFTTIHMQLLAVGNRDETGAPNWSRRPFPARFSLVETIRAWGEWKRQQAGHESKPTKLILYVVDRSVSRELSSGRIDVLELLRCPDIAFWTEMVENGALLERRRFQEDDNTLLNAVVDQLALDPTCWDFEVSPPAAISTNTGQVHLDGAHEGSAWLSLPLRDLGVVPGSTIHFRRPRL